MTVIIVNNPRILIKYILLIEEYSSEFDLDLAQGEALAEGELGVHGVSYRLGAVPVACEAGGVEAR